MSEKVVFDFVTGFGMVPMGHSVNPEASDESDAKSHI